MVLFKSLHLISNLFPCLEKKSNDLQGFSHLPGLKIKKKELMEMLLQI